MTVTQAPPSAIGQGGRIFIFGFLSAIAPLSIDIYLPALPTMRAALGANEAQTLYTLSTFFIGFGGGQLLFGPLTDRFGRKRPLICALAVYIAASVGCALAPSITMLIFFALSRRSAVPSFPSPCRPWCATFTRATRAPASCRSISW